jgi:hypothetical protein
VNVIMFVMFGAALYAIRISAASPSQDDEVRNSEVCSKATDLAKKLRAFESNVAAEGKRMEAERKNALDGAATEDEKQSIFYRENLRMMVWSDELQNEFISTLLPAFVEVREELIKRLGRREPIPGNVQRVFVGLVSPGGKILSLTATHLEDLGRMLCFRTSKEPK